MLTKIRIFLKTIILLCFVSSIFAQETLEHRIISPRTGHPIFIIQGEEIPVKIQTVSNYKQIRAKLISCGKEEEAHQIILKVKKIKWDENIFTIVFSGNKNIPFDLYHLIIEIEYNGEKTNLFEERCIKIIDKYKKDFYFAVLSDMHVTEKVEFFSSEKNVEKIEKIIKEINLISPEFAVICGDIVNGHNYEKEYELVKKVFSNLQIPTFIIPGNHDTSMINIRKQRKILTQDGQEYFKNYIGDLYYIANYGDFKMLMINTFDKPVEERGLLSFYGGMSLSQFEFVENQLSNWKGKQKILFMHHSIHDKEWEENLWDKIYSIIKNYKVNYVFSGHEHQDRVIKEDETTFVWNTSAGGGLDSDLVREGRKGYEGYRIVRVKDNRIISFNYEEPQYSYPAYQIDFYRENDEYVFENNLKEDITFHFRVVLPKDKKIKSNQVNILQKVEIPSGIKYYFQTKIKSNTKNRIKLYD